MKTSTIIYIAVFILLIIVIVRYVNKSKSVSDSNVTNLQNGFGTLVQTFVPKPTLTAVVPDKPVQTTGFKFGDKIYAVSNITNVYKNPVLSTANLDSFKPYSANDLLGTFLGYSGNFVKLNATNPARVTYAVSSQVYTK